MPVQHLSGAADRALDGIERVETDIKDGAVNVFVTDFLNHRVQK